MEKKESKIDFDYLVSTEDRFALRKWFEEFVEAGNTAPIDVIKNYLDEELVIEGLGDAKILYNEAMEGIKSLVGTSSRVVMDYPDVKFKFQHVLFSMQGSFEGFIDGIMSYDGTFEAKLAKSDDGFKIIFIKLFPRLMLKKS